MLVAGGALICGPGCAVLWGRWGAGGLGLVEAYGGAGPGWAASAWDVCPGGAVWGCHGCTCCALVCILVGIGGLGSSFGSSTISGLTSLLVVPAVPVGTRPLCCFLATEM